MNTNPDDAKLALWLDDELHGDELAEVEAWAGKDPGHVAAREEIRRWRSMISSSVPASVEPPYADLFNGRIAKAIREPLPESVVAMPARGFSLRAILMPLAACAGMVFAFWLGGKTQNRVPEIDVTGAPKAIPVEPIVYTPDRGVEAEWFASDDASATVIVLNGVDAIPDATDFSKNASTDGMREIDSTAAAGSESNESPGL